MNINAKKDEDKEERQQRESNLQASKEQTAIQNWAFYDLLEHEGRFLKHSAGEKAVVLPSELAQLGLSEADRKHLRERGITASTVVQSINKAIGVVFDTNIRPTQKFHEKVLMRFSRETYEQFRRKYSRLQAGWGSKDVYVGP